MNFSNNTNISQSYLCPITHQLINDPVIDNEGNSYEKNAILEWLARNNTSPITRNPLAATDLSPNRVLKDLIDEYKLQNGLDSAEKKDEQSITRDIDMSPVTMHVTSKGSQYMVSINTPIGKDGLPVDACAVVDISGSMGIEATVKNSSGQNESHGLTILDVTKHALKTIVYTLDEDDRFSLVSYSTSARVAMKLEKMTIEGKQKAISIIESLHTEGSTNLWDGLQTGMNVLQDSSESGRSSGIFLLTDGMPNIEPPRGHLPMLKKYMDQFPDFSCTINTFGFGYSLDSSLLNELSCYGNGAYSFIPDPGLVGTVFEHSLSNFLTTVGSNCTLSIETVNGSSITNISDGLNTTPTSWGSMINLGSIPFGQSKNINIELANFDVSQPSIVATLKYFDQRTGTVVQVNMDSHCKDFNDENVYINYCRNLFVDYVTRAFNYMECGEPDNAQSTVNELLSILKSGHRDNYINDLIKDVEGQVTEAFSRTDWFNRWGKHYIPSLVRTHVLQQCNNFRDPGVQHYGGELFKKIRDKADDIFTKLPPPKPSVVRSHYRGGGSQTPVAVTSMRQYSQPSGPCFDGNCLVSMYNGSEKKIVDLRKGDEVVTPNGKKAVIKCIVKTNTKNNMEVLVSLGKGLKATKWHPIRIDGKWMFPYELGQGVVMKCPAVFSFVLDTEDEHVMVINNIECIALGHNINEPVAQHSYFGTDAVINDLRQMSGYDQGLIELNPGCMVRDEQSGRVCKLKQ